MTWKPWHPRDGVHEYKPPSTVYCVECANEERHPSHGWTWDPDTERWVEPAWWPPAETLAVRGAEDGAGLRVTDAELACRTGADGRRYLAGIAVPYGRRSDPVRIGGRRMIEMFAAGAAKIDPRRGVVLRSRHPDPALRGADRVDTIIGRATSHEQQPEGLWAEFRLARSEKAERLWGMADDGTLTGLSVEFPQRADAGYAYRDLPAPSADELPLRIVQSAPIRGCALVDHGAYADAGVSVTRAADDPMTGAELDRWLRLDRIRRRIDILERTAP